MLHDYIAILKALKVSPEPLSGTAVGRALGLYNTTATSRLRELAEFGLTEKVYTSEHIHLWTITRSGRAVLGLLETLGTVEMEGDREGGGEAANHDEGA